MSNRPGPDPLPPRGYRALIVWQKAIAFADDVLTVCERVPVRAGAGLVPQLRRSAISVPSNVAEGHDRPAGEQLNYLRHPRGSLWESATQAELLHRRGAVKNESVVVLLQQSDEIGRLIHGYTRRVAEDDD